MPVSLTANCWIIIVPTSQNSRVYVKGKLLRYGWMQKPCPVGGNYFDDGENGNSDDGMLMTSASVICCAGHVEPDPETSSRGR